MSHWIKLNKCLLKEMTGKVVPCSLKRTLFSKDDHFQKLDFQIRVGSKTH